MKKILIGLCVIALLLLIQSIVMDRLDDRCSRAASVEQVVLNEADVDDFISEMESFQIVEAVDVTDVAVILDL